MAPSPPGQPPPLAPAGGGRRAAGGGQESTSSAVHVSMSAIGGPDHPRCTLPTALRARGWHTRPRYPRPTGRFRRHAPARRRARTRAGGAGRGGAGRGRAGRGGAGRVRTRPLPRSRRRGWRARRALGAPPSSRAPRRALARRRGARLRASTTRRWQPARAFVRRSGDGCCSHTDTHTSSQTRTRTHTRTQTHTHTHAHTHTHTPAHSTLHGGGRGPAPARPHGAPSRARGAACCPGGRSADGTPAPARRRD
jgi:hypothetical protein